MVEPLEWGVAPLPEQQRFAEVMRDVTSLVVSLERAEPALLDLVETLEAAQQKLAGLLPASARPRVGRHADGPGRVYIDHCRDIGSWNPMFPIYQISVEGPERATGVVNFPLCYEGPAGYVNGGFLGVFFDSIVQHHNCQLGLSGATRDLDIDYRRPAPLLVDLDFEITRTVDERSVGSEARVSRAGELLCSARTSAARFPRAQSPAVSPRRCLTAMPMTDVSDRTVGGVLRRRAAEDRDHLFLICDDERLTYGELLDRSTTLAKGLVAAGAGRGTHIGLLLPNGADFAVAALAIMRIGAVAVPISTLSSVAELHTLIDRSDTQLLLAAVSFRNRNFHEFLVEAIGLESPSVPPVLATKTPTLRQIFFYGDGELAVGTDPGWRVDALYGGADRISDELLDAMEAGVRPGDPVVIVHTSGSTSAPKGVLHAHGGMLDHLKVLNDLRSYRPDDILFSNSPFFWIGGFAYTFLGTLVAGATVLCSREADAAKVLDLLERERPTMCNGYAASATALAADPSFPSRDLSSIRRGNLYAIMPKDVVPADPQLRTNLLGMTEGGSVVLSGTDENDLPEHLRGSFGRPTPDLAARIVDRTTGEDCSVGERGELWLRGPAMMLGYYGLERSQAFDADGWFHTGDLVHQDVHGHWYFHGRGDDMIKTAGANVSPAEVQDAILAATGLTSIAFGLPDPDKGQVVAAALVLDEGSAQAPDPDELRGLLAPLLSSYKIPRVVRALRNTDLPLRSSGKVDMSQLKQIFGAD